MWLLGHYFLINDRDGIGNKLDRLNIEVLLERGKVKVVEGSMERERVGFPNRFHELEWVEVKFFVELAVGDAEDGLQLGK